MEDIGVNTLMIEVTNRCNLNCPHCYYYEDGEKGTDYNDFIDLKAIDHLLNDMKIKYIGTLNFTGGEPLLAEAKIIEVLHKILEDNVLVISIDIASNGTILSEKFAYELNEFSKKQYYFLKNHGMKEVRKQIENFDKNKPDTFPNECTVNFRISNLWHSNDPKRAYEFYKEKMPNVLVEIMSEDISDEEFKEIFILDGTASEKKRISYSGRAKKLTNYNFYCEPLYHKIVYDNNNFEVKCPLKMSYNGKISLAGACSQCDCNKAAIGSVFDGKSLREMITEWNYKTPLTCKESCELEEFRMAKELGNDWFDRLNGEENNLTDEKIEKGVRGKELRMFFLENYRLKLHEKVPCLTPEELENISLYALDREESSLDMSEEEYEKIGKEIDNEIARMIWEHSFDDVKELHEKYSYLTVEECKEFLDCCERMEEYKAPALVLLLDWKDFKRCCELEELNEYRKENVESEF